MGREQVEGTNDVTVHFGTVHSMVKVYDLTLGAAPPTQILSNVTDVPLSVSDHALIIEIQ